MKKVNVFYKLVFSLFWLLVIANTTMAGTPVSGIISSNTTWTVSASPYIVTGNVLVNSGVTLIIEPGVIVKFDTDKAIQINGELIAVGTDGNMIVFTSNQTEPAAGDWAYIFFSDTSTDATFDIDENYTSGSILEYCVVEYAGGVSVSDNGAVRMDNAHPFINHCSIQNNSASGINAYNLSGTLKISNNTVNDNEGTGISFNGYSGTVTVFGNFVHNNTGSSNNAGGINAGCTCLISNNLISNNSGSSGGGVLINNGTATISGNIINGNNGTYGGGIRGGGTISNNIIFDNTASSRGGGIYEGEIISNNIISNNIASYESGGIETGRHITNNSIIRNSAPNAAALSQDENYEDYLNYNLITDNNCTGTEPTYTLNISTYADSNNVFNYNNFFNNTATYELWNDTAAGSPDVNAMNNWWGTTVEAEIQTKIYDWFDDASKSIVDYTPFDTAIRTDAPISPPTGMVISKTLTDIILDWDANPEADIAGYKVYWGTQAIPFIENVVDVGSNLSHTITGLAPGAYHVAVTAYDNDYNPANDNADTIVNENQTNGNESWYTDGVAWPGTVDVSGRVTDKQTSLPLADITVGCWHEDAEIWNQTQTDANGQYEIANLPPGFINISAMPQSYYARVGAELELTGDVTDLDFALPVGATFSGIVIDKQTAQPLSDVTLEYWNNLYCIWQETQTDEYGMFLLTNLPPGTSEIEIYSDVATGYAGYLWGSNWISLSEGQEKSECFMGLSKGALVCGFIKDSNGDPLADIEFGYEGKNSEGWPETDANGYYQIRLPEGTYTIGTDFDDEGFASLNELVTVTDINQSINVPDIIAYDQATGGQISGTVNNAGSYPKNGTFVVMAFEAGTVVNPDNWHTFWNVCIIDMDQAGPFTITALPPGVNYDIYLCIEKETPEDVESIVFRDIAYDVPVGTSGINLYYNSEGYTVSGTTENINNDFVIGGGVLLYDSSTLVPAGFADADSNGQYFIYNVPPGNYTATATHNKYQNTSTPVQVVDGNVDAGIIVMDFAGEKEGPDLNGDGVVNLGDFAEFANQWLQTGSLEANFDQQGEVDFADFARFAYLWLWQASWY